MATGGGSASPQDAAGKTVNLAIMGIFTLTVLLLFYSVIGWWAFLLLPIIFLFAIAIVDLVERL
jgi:hypothetical protein